VNPLVFTPFLARRQKTRATMQSHALSQIWGAQGHVSNGCAGALGKLKREPHSLCATASRNSKIPMIGKLATSALANRIEPVRLALLHFGVDNAAEPGSSSFFSAWPVKNALCRCNGGRVHTTIYALSGKQRNATFIKEVCGFASLSGIRRAVSEILKAKRQPIC
jgi:hypothetical protein